ncbi:restriction endonuclease [Patescibacteria group bacterium]|nr:restriction endonuclease [Patescibacteria group bacterium]
MKQVYIVKADGSTRQFSFKKLVRSVQRSGASNAIAKDVATAVLAKLPNRVTTNQIYDLIYKELRGARMHPTAQVYSLRRSLADLSPEEWEKYTAKIFSYYGYTTEWNKIVPGAAVEHQVDVIATKGNKQWLIECKHHFSFHNDTGLGEVLRVQARLEDTQDGFKKKTTKYNFTGAWLVVNTKFSDHAKRYAAAKGINMSGWRYPDQYSLERLIQDQSVFPVTILNIDKKTKNYLLHNGIITIQDVLEMPPKLEKIMDAKKLSRLRDQVSKLIEYAGNL